MRSWVPLRVGVEKLDLDEELDLAWAQLDRCASKSAFATIEAPVSALR
jgi:hypothetical protein